MNVITKSVDIGGKTISFETGRLAKQASGAVVVRQGDSHLLVTAVCESKEQNFDFLPLTVNYQDRNGAAGTIPGGYLKREGGRSERETLICRLIDRPIRPMFPKHFRKELQLIATCLSYDRDCETDVLALCGASAAMHISHAPMSAPIAGVRVCRVDGQLVLNPTYDEREAADIDLIIAGTVDAITMVEGGALEAQEADMLDAFDLAQDAIRKLIGCIEELRKEAGREKIEVPDAPQVDPEIATFMTENGQANLVTALAIPEKHKRSDSLKAERNAVIEKLLESRNGDESADADGLTAGAKKAWEGMVRSTMRNQVLSTNTRIDGRAPEAIRGIWADVGIAPRAHGSAVFTRGETQGFVSIALGTDDDVQRMETPQGRFERRFMLTYNFLPFCTGEARRIMGPKRREVGHGALARRAILPVLPSKEDFPYVMRSTSDILESNGSSSMATVCATILALMDAAVPIKAPVAGIAMGLIKEGDDYAVLSDILGDEDHLGDMDFKVTGTEKGITAFQMDVKITGITREIMSTAMSQARDGRLHILAEMSKSLAGPREEMSEYAPRITTIEIKQDKIRELIGPGGKMIRSIQETCEVKIRVDDSGKVDIASNNADKTEKALQMIREITQEAEIGALYYGIVKRIVDFGAFVEIFPGTDGLVHISQLANERVDQVTDILSEGDEVLVKVIDMDRSGKIRLSRKEALSSLSQA